MPLEFSRIVIATPLVSLDTAKAHLRITDSDHDVDVEQKRKAAQDRVVAYVSAAADPSWDELTVPTPIAQAILLLLTDFYENRGEAVVGAGTEHTWSAIERLLSMYRDPTLA
jgi:Phage gp6-like head-tail connector protein